MILSKLNEENLVEIASKPKKYLTNEQLKKDKYRAVSDYVSGMTDRFAINLYNNIK